jgi:hypothetical protein
MLESGKLAQVHSIALSMMGLIAGWLGWSIGVLWALHGCGPETEKKIEEKEKENE